MSGSAYAKQYVTTSANRATKPTALSAAQTKQATALAAALAAAFAAANPPPAFAAAHPPPPAFPFAPVEEYSQVDITTCDVENGFVFPAVPLPTVKVNSQVGIITTDDVWDSCALGLPEVQAPWQTLVDDVDV